MRHYKSGLVIGQFDIIHAGYINMFEQAKNKCDFLTVGLHNDPSIERPHKHKPIMSIVERQKILSGIKQIDNVIVYNFEKDILDILYLYDFDVRFIGSDYLGKDSLIYGKDVCEKLSIDIVFLTRDHSISYSEVRNRIKG